MQMQRGHPAHRDADLGATGSWRSPEWRRELVPTDRHPAAGVAAVGVELMPSNDVRMGQQLQVLEFALQLGEKFVSLGNRRMENFDRYPLPGGGPIDAILVDGVEHGAHAALPEYSPYPIAATQHVADRHFPSDFSQCPA